MIKEKGFEKAQIGLADSGHGFPLPQLEDMKSALPERRAGRNVDDIVAPLRVAKDRTRARRHERSRAICCTRFAPVPRRSSSRGEKSTKSSPTSTAWRATRAPKIFVSSPATRRLNPPSFKQTASIGVALGALSRRAA